MFGHSHNEEIFPDVQSEAPLVQLCAIPLHPVIGYWEQRPAPPPARLLLRRLHRAVRPPLSLLFWVSSAPPHRTCLPTLVQALLPSSRGFQGL